MGLKQLGCTVCGLYLDVRDRANLAVMLLTKANHSHAALEPARCE